MIGNARLEVDCSRNCDYIAWERSVTDRRQTDKGVYRAAGSQLKTWKIKPENTVIVRLPIVLQDQKKYIASAVKTAIRGL